MMKLCVMFLSEICSIRQLQHNVSGLEFFQTFNLVQFLVKYFHDSSHILHLISWSFAAYGLLRYLFVAARELSEN
ncbi:hypothetical protein T4D_1577 [Trichinella pseudospiralis]|uniref:Uncharacterized protein n=1 Tax=Trichinella pseudospiralis TaxID=6337 RepID=A0A0V1FD37_TRIPS|nr:hypothetical protein T4D_1577 [Trichinella pseudospiralis]